MTDYSWVYDRTIKTFGEAAQMDKVTEEAAELIVALRHYMAGREPAAKVVEEIADMEIMCGQLRRIFGEVLVDQAKQDKIDRLTVRLDEHGGPVNKSIAFLRSIGREPDFTLEH